MSRDTAMNWASPTGHRLERLVCYLRFDLARMGRTNEALELLRRILDHPRLARAVCSHPITGRLPWVLVQGRTEATDEQLRSAIRQLQPHLPLYGQAQCEYAYHMLGDLDAPKRIQALLEQSLRQGLSIQPAGPITSSVRPE